MSGIDHENNVAKAPASTVVQEFDFNGTGSELSLEEIAAGCKFSDKSHYDENVEALEKVLEAMTHDNDTMRDRGTRFERFIVDYLRNDRALKEQYQRIETYAEWAERTQLPTNKKDTGIDLVATHRKPVEDDSSVDKETYTAIQCKFYEKQHVVSKADVDSFLGALGQKFFTDGMIVTTSLHITDNLTETISRTGKHIFVITRDVLARSSIKWDVYLNSAQQIVHEERELRDYQKDAITKAIHGLQTHDRGKLIMACGTGKTFTSLRLAERWSEFAHQNEHKLIKDTIASGISPELAALHAEINFPQAPGGFVLFLVPSLSLLAQTLSDWKQNSARNISAFAVCSDTSIGKKTKKAGDVDADELFAKSELSIPATTDGATLAKNVNRRIAIPYNPQDSQHGMTVVFATYQSIDVIIDAQLNHQMPEFDLIICDEAHRTAGGYATAQAIEAIKAEKEAAKAAAKDAALEQQANTDMVKTLDADLPTSEQVNTAEAKKQTTKQKIASVDTEDSTFWKVHNNNLVHGKKRIYMTATPKIFGEDLKSKKSSHDIELYSMDDETVFGPVLFSLNFHEAVKLGCLVDYKVIVLAVPSEVGKVKDVETLSTYNSSRLIGAWKALNKFGLKEDLIGDDSPMKRAVAFAQVIDEPKGKNKERTASSKQLSQYIGDVVQRYREDVLKKGESCVDYEYVSSHNLNITADHIDGSMNAIEKAKRLDWLRSNDDLDEKCKVLFNVRCLSEGVDVPSLDAVIFFAPRSSQVEVVQSVGRVMRRAPGKKRGYVIIPIVSHDMENPEKVFDYNTEYKAVWQVLNALRSINPAPLVSADGTRLDARIEVVAVSNALNIRGAEPKPKVEPIIDISGKNGTNGKGTSTGGDGGNGANDDNSKQGSFDLVFEEELRARIIKRVGSRKEWEDWAKEVGEICRKQIDLIKLNLESPEFADVKAHYPEFKQELCTTLRRQLSDDEVIEMLGQHVVIAPVLDALFPGVPFTEKNPLARGLSGFVNKLVQKSDDHDLKEMQGFVNSVKSRMESVKTLSDRQSVIVELFDRFFKHAFPKMQEKLGIVYTPVEVVDFINNSVNEILKKDFNLSLASKGVHILDPFTGTGTFIARMMQDEKLLPNDAIYDKYLNELHAFEIVPLAYYVAAMNIESVMQQRDPTKFDAARYKASNVVILTDTFASPAKQLSLLPDSELALNNEHRAAVDDLDLTVIVGNPPYSVGQKNANDNNQNEKYEELDARLAETYVEKAGKVTNKNKLYDSYIRAFRWASDRIGNKGIIAFVTNAGWIDAESANGMRQCICEEFNDIYIYHLKGNQRTSGERSRQEGGKIFGEGSRAPIAITLLVKNKSSKEFGKIHFSAVDDYLSREDKLKELESNVHILNTKASEITPDEHGDWINQRRSDYLKFVSTDGKSKDTNGIFINYSLGLNTGRDQWSVNSSIDQVLNNFNNLIKFYNSQVDLQLSQGSSYVENNDASKIKWNDTLRAARDKGIKFDRLEVSSVVSYMYRPFYEQVVNYNKQWCERTYQMPKIFTSAGHNNLCIGVSGKGAKTFSVFITKTLPCLDCLEKSQWLPRFVYNENEAGDFIKNSAIDHKKLHHYQLVYGNDGVAISEDDLFYYIYGILHSNDYRTTYADNLVKELPRIPRVESFDDFMAFAEAGRKLAKLHTEYDSVEPYAGCELVGNFDDSKLRVEALKYGKIAGKKGDAAKDRSMIIYNEHLTIKNIPLEAQEYVVNAKSALDWVVERCCVKTDKDSGIVNDYNDMIEAKGDPMYLVKHILRVITVSLETMKIVKGLPPLKIHPLDL